MTAIHNDKGRVMNEQEIMELANALVRDLDTGLLPPRGAHGIWVRSMVEGMEKAGYAITPPQWKYSVDHEGPQTDISLIFCTTPRNKKLVVAWFKKSTYTREEVEAECARLNKKARP